MKKIIFSIGILTFSFQLYSCSDNTLRTPTFSLEDFESSTVVIMSTYDELISLIGPPDTTFVFRYRHRLNSENNTSVTKSCDLLFYTKRGLSYLYWNDSVFLRSIDYNADLKNRLIYKNMVFDNNFSMSDASNYLNLDDSCFFQLYNEYEMCGLDTAGFLLIFCNDSEEIVNSYKFYFGKDSCLKGMYFPVNDR